MYVSIYLLHTTTDTLNRYIFTLDSTLGFIINIVLNIWSTGYVGHAVI